MVSLLALSLPSQVCFPNPSLNTCIHLCQPKLYQKWREKNAVKYYYESLEKNCFWSLKNLMKKRIYILTLLKLHLVAELCFI